MGVSHDPSEELLERWELFLLIVVAKGAGGVDVRLCRELGGGVVFPLRRGVDWPWGREEYFFAKGSPWDCVVTLMLVRRGSSSSRLQK